VLGLSETAERNGQPWAWGRVTASDGGEHVVVCDRAQDRSNQPAQDTANRLIRGWAPRVLLVSDIGGGIHGGGSDSRDGIRLGDVVYANNLEYYELVKETPSGGRTTSFPFHPRACLSILSGVAATTGETFSPSDSRNVSRVGGVAVDRCAGRCLEGSAR
jgi:hypothetical protein